MFYKYPMIVDVNVYMRLLSLYFNYIKVVYIVMFFEMICKSIYLRVIPMYKYIGITRK